MEEKNNSLDLLLNFDKIIMDWIKRISLTKCIAIIASIFIIAITIDEIVAPKGTNVKMGSSYTSGVFFYPDCPNCHHIGSIESIEISKGESYESYRTCNKCSEFFLIKIRR